MPSADAKRSNRRVWSSRPREGVRFEDCREATRAEPRATKTNEANSTATRLEMRRACMVTPSLRKANRFPPRGGNEHRARAANPTSPRIAPRRESGPAATPAGCPPCGDRIARIILRVGVGIKAQSRCIKRDFFTRAELWKATALVTNLDNVVYAVYTRY